jgi:hypothetical protein
MLKTRVQASIRCAATAEADASGVDKSLKITFMAPKAFQN